MKKLTRRELKKNPPNTILRQGIMVDADPPRGDFSIWGTGDELPWVARRDGIGNGTWDIRVAKNTKSPGSFGWDDMEDWTPERLTSWGYKLFTREQIENLVTCTNPAFSLYRY